MTWTYNVSQLTTSQLMQVRYLVGDTIAGPPNGSLVQDEEINFAISLSGNVYSAAAQVCRSLAAQMSRESDAGEGVQRINYSVRSRAYKDRAAEYEALAITSGGAFGWAGGISVTQKATQQANTDRVQPQFQIGMTDNPLPVGPAGNESSDDGV